MSQVVKTEVFFGRGRATLSNAIVVAECPLNLVFYPKYREQIASHVGLKFTFDNGEILAAHAKLREDYRVESWMAVENDYKQSGGWTISKELDLPGDSVFKDCQDMVGQVKYSINQFWRKLLFLRVGLPMPNTPNEVDCSEAYVLIVNPWQPCLVINGFKYMPDEVSPYMLQMFYNCWGPNV